jgi:mannonate dehydratase
MAHIGWCRTSSDIIERGGATVTGFNIQDFKAKENVAISEKELWDNYEYFLKAVIPTAEKYGIKLALHPDDPPVPKLGDVSRIMVSVENIKKALYGIYPSENLGLTMCQANFYIMGADLEKTIREFAEKIFFVHFRNTTGSLKKFRETFHDNGDLDMAKLLCLYTSLGIDVPIRVDHVPTLKGEDTQVAGYAAQGRLFAIGYLKGLLEMLDTIKK